MDRYCDFCVIFDRACRRFLQKDYQKIPKWSIYGLAKELQGKNKSDSGQDTAKESVHGS